MSVFYSIYYSVLTFMMAFYDYSNPRYFAHQALEQVFLVKMIYTLILIHIVLIISNVTFKFKENKESRLVESSKTLVIPVFSFIFFINDEVERLQFIILTYTCFSVIYTFFKNVSNKKSRLIFLVIMIKLINYFYFYLSGTYSFDTSIKAGNKTIAQEQDDAAIFTGFLFTVQKFQAHIYGSFVILSLVKIQEKFRREGINSV